LQEMPQLAWAAADVRPVSVVVITKEDELRVAAQVAAVIV
jgi:hypothetical protein